MRTVLVVLLVVCAATLAQAQPKLALTAIDGDDSGDVREAVAEALDGKELSIIGAKETNRAIDKLKIELPDVTEKQAKKLADNLEADAVVSGTLGNEGKSKLLKFKLFVNGKKVKGFSVQFSNPRSKKFKEALREKMVEKVSTPAPIADKDDKKKPKQTAQVEEDDPPKKKKKKKKTLKKQKADGEPDEGDEPVKKETATAEEDEVDEDEVDEAEFKIVRKSPHTANRAAIRVDVGTSVSTRSLTFTFTPELAADNLQPQPFKPGPVAGARVEGDIFPLAFGDPDSYASGIGLAFEFDQVLSSKVQTTLEPGRIGKVKQQHYLVGARYRLVFTTKPTSPSITFGMGYGRRSFIVQSGFMDRDLNLDLPDTDYTYLAPMFGFRIPITGSIALASTNEAMLVRDAGRISDSDQYGRAKVFGFDTQTGLDITIKNRVAIRLMFEYAQIGFTFTGGGDKARNRDLQPETVDIGGALDRSIGGVGTLAVLY
jgi:opacity protein-like surface antigen